MISIKNSKMNDIKNTLENLKDIKDSNKGNLNLV